jgi:predicted HicB family RNase H-like nuclease
MKTPLVREKLTLRLPVELHRLLTDAADENGRSLNSEIVQRLKRGFATAGVETNRPGRTQS